MTYSTTPELLKTIAAVPTGAPTASATTTGRAPVATFTGAANGLFSGAGLALSGALGAAAVLL
jgi:hypothetical protein